MSEQDQCNDERSEQDDEIEKTLFLFRANEVEEQVMRTCMHVSLCDAKPFKSNCFDSEHEGKLVSRSNGDETQIPALKSASAEGRLFFGTCL